MLRCHDGTKAIDFWRMVAADLLIPTFSCPIMDGIETLRAGAEAATTIADHCHLGRQFDGSDHFLGFAQAFGAGHGVGEAVRCR